MADDKGGSGGGWQTFEIVIVILLAIGLLNRLQGKPDITVDNKSDTKQEQLSQSIDQTPLCGLSISLPRPLEQVRDFVSLAGSTSGCDWSSTQTAALYAQVVDPKGLPISPYTIVPPNDFDEVSGGAAFNTTISFSSTPNKGTGYLILVSTKNNDGHTINTRIPLSFK